MLHSDGDGRQAPAAISRRQSDAALDPIEQEKAQFVLQVLDLPRQRRLRDAQVVAGFPKILPARGPG
jgi:hypothetical protein